MNLDLFSLHGKNALVTGSRTGLGAGIAIGLAQAGANVVVHGSKDEGFDEVCAAIEAAGVKAIRVRADLADLKSCDHLIDSTVRELGSPRILSAASRRWTRDRGRRWR